MKLAREIPSNKLGFYLPVYRDDLQAARSIKRIVCRSFREAIREIKSSNDFIMVKNFEWIEHSFVDAPYIKDYLYTYGWKAEILSLRIER